MVMYFSRPILDCLQSNVNYYDEYLQSIYTHDSRKYSHKINTILKYTFNISHMLLYLCYTKYVVYIRA